MTVIAPPLDTGGGAIFFLYGPKYAAGSGKNGDDDRLGTAGWAAELTEHMFDMQVA